MEEEKLRTLKEILENYRDNDEMIIENGFVLEEHLKAEAVKWALECREKIGTGELNGTHRVMWFWMKKLDITDEDLK